MDRARLQREANRSLREIATEQMLRKYTKILLLKCSYFTELSTMFSVNAEPSFM